MTDLDSKARAITAYKELDKELRHRKLQVIGACIATVLLSTALVLYFCATQPAGPVVRRTGTVIRLMQVADDTAHDVRLVVALDQGPSILLRAFQLVPIGGRVIIGERKNHLGWSTYAFIGLESKSKRR